VHKVLLRRKSSARNAYQLLLVTLLQLLLRNTTPAPCLRTLFLACCIQVHCVQRCALQCCQQLAGCHLLACKHTLQPNTRVSYS
jgi:hypothetical protein